jgi:hypothetical protein
MPEMFVIGAVRLVVFNPVVGCSSFKEVVGLVTGVLETLATPGIFMLMDIERFCRINIWGLASASVSVSPWLVNIEATKDKAL